jgi:hypothetical protein
MHEPYWKTGGVAEQEGDEQGNGEPWAHIFTLTATGLIDGTHMPHTQPPLHISHSQHARP